MTTPSIRPGMGAIPYRDGVTFRVWAPFARSMAVAGTFNGGSRTANPLAPDEHGYWSADVPEAKVGDEYRYVVDGNHERIDPRAQQVTHSAGQGIVANVGLSNQRLGPHWHVHALVPGGGPSLSGNRWKHAEAPD